MLNHMGRKASTVLFIAVTLALAGAALLLAGHGSVERQSFKAFYCAGVAVKDHADPYLVEPLRACERRLAPSDLPDGYVEPAPMPGYAMAPFAALARLSPRVAALLFAALLALAATLSACALAEMLPAPRSAVLLALAPLTLLNVAYGEVVPFALVGICGAAFLIWRGRWFAAGLAVCVALIQPNVGLPAVAAVFLFAPRARGAVAAGVAALALLSVVAIGFDRNVEYLTQVLPGMANAEIVASDQYNLTHLLFAAGVAAPIAALLGKVWFVVVAGVGIVTAGVLAVRRREPELLPLVPPAAALLFGIYLHDIQMLLALPAALMLASRIRGTTYHALATIAVALLVAVWTQRAGTAVIALNALAVAGGVFAVSTMKNRIAVSVLAALGTVAGVVALQRVQPPLVGSSIVTHVFHAASGDWAFSAWAAYLRATPALTAPALLLKFPTWIGLLLVTICALRLSLQAPRPRGVDPAIGATPSLSGSREPQLASAPYSVFSQKYD
jgi:hypothetical protein